MPQICIEESHFNLPDICYADEEGLVLIGGKPTPARVLEAYKRGIFPWYNNDVLPLWWSPDPRFVLFPHELHISRSMHRLLAKGNFDFTMNTAFEEVINACAGAERAGQEGTWITKLMNETYKQLHKEGYGYSAEAWRNGELMGGIYGLKIGRVFFGESMFSKESNASKYAFIKCVHQFRLQGVELVDCQVYTTHLESLGAKSISRQEYMALLQHLIN